KPAPARIASAVDENVERFAAIAFGEFAVELLEQGRNGRCIDEVSEQRKGAATGVVDGGDRLVSASFARVVSQRDCRAFFGETLGNRAADAPRPSSDQSGFSDERL